MSIMAGIRTKTVSDTTAMNPSADPSAAAAYPHRRPERRPPRTMRVEIASDPAAAPNTAAVFGAPPHPEPTASATNSVATAPTTTMVVCIKATPTRSDAMDPRRPGKGEPSNPAPASTRGGSGARSSFCIAADDMWQSLSGEWPRQGVDPRIADERQNILRPNFPNENRMRAADPDGGRSTAQLRYVPHPRSGGRMEREALLGALASFSLFADLSQPELEGISHTFDEEWYSEGQRILRRGFAGSGFHLILEGEAAVRIDGDDRARLARGDRRERARWPSVELCAHSARHQPRGCFRGRLAWRNVPEVSDTPTPDQLEQAACTRRTRNPQLRTVRLEQPHRRRTCSSRHPSPGHGWKLLFPLEVRDGKRARGLCGESGPCHSIRVQVGVNRAGGRRIRPHNIRW